MRIAGPDQKEWIKHVQKIRAAHNSLGKMAPRVVVSPRASITGAKLIRNGIITDWEELDNALIWQGCSRDDKERVIKAMR
jgi:hypothetical protein